METNYESTTTTVTTTGSGFPLRPTFLTVLCILTFIGSGWGVYKGISGYYTADSTAQIVSETKSKVDDQMEGKEQPAFVKNMMGSMFNAMSPDNIRKSSLISLLASIFTLVGGIMMWQLRRIGFYIYIAGIIISIIAPIVILGGGLMGMAAGGFTAFIGIVFIALYGVNIRYMVR